MTLTLVIFPSDATQDLLFYLDEFLYEGSRVFLDGRSLILALRLDKPPVVLFSRGDPFVGVHLERGPLELRSKVHEEVKFVAPLDSKATNVEFRQS